MRSETEPDRERKKERGGVTRFNLEEKYSPNDFFEIKMKGNTCNFRCENDENSDLSKLFVTHTSYSFQSG